MPATSNWSDGQIEAAAANLRDQMTLDEKIAQMSGDQSPLLDGWGMLRAYNASPIPGGENRRLGIPGIRFSDGPRGVVMYESTCFPVSMARGASWDVELEERIGDAIGVEVRTQGANFFGGVCVNLLRHPAWGRAQETYGEDPHLLGEMGVALTRGVQRHVMACVKHFACNSIENARFRVNVQVDERTLREVYLPHFKQCVDAGVASVMSAYNQVNGAFCGHNDVLLRSILKEEWGFEGFVISDFVFGVKGADAAAAGLDIEMPFTLRFGRNLKRAIRKGKVSETAIDNAVLRIVRAKLRFAGVGEPERYRQDAVAGDAHRQLAREAACKSMVLLKNEVVADSEQPLLPLKGGQAGQIAVIGRLADIANTGDHGSSMVRPPYVVTPLAGIRAAVGDVLFDDGSDVQRAVRTAKSAETVVIVVGYTHADEGEYIKTPLRKAIGGDRAALTLHAHDEALIRAVAAANPRTVVVMVGGSAIVTEAWRQTVPAIVMAWYAGMEGGHALADILFGAVNPSAKLPCTFPKSAAQLPFFDRNATTITYDYLHGYWLLDRDGHEPAFAFGFGLSYTTFAVTDLRLSAAEIAVDGTVTVQVTVANTGTRAGAEVVQLYVGCDDGAVMRPKRRLYAFRKVALESGERQDVAFELSAEALAYFDVSGKAWRVEPAMYTVYVGSSSRSAELLAEKLRIVSGMWEGEKS